MKKARSLDPACKKIMEKECFTQAKELISLDDYKNAKTELIKVLMLNPESVEAEGLLRRIKDIIEINKE